MPQLRDRPQQVRRGASWATDAARLLAGEVGAEARLLAAEAAFEVLSTLALMYVDDFVAPVVGTQQLQLVWGA